MQRLWIAATLVMGAVPVWAQPDNVGTMAPSDEIAVAELERAIGGRTTLALQFKDLTSEQVTDVVAKASGLPFLAPLPAPGGAMRASVLGVVSRRVVVPGALASAQPEPEAATWNGAVDETDFWPALRRWGRAENVRLQREREAVQKGQQNEQMPSPVVGDGQPLTPEDKAEWEKKVSEWSQRRSAELRRFDPNLTLSAAFDTNAAAWRLTPSSQLTSGRAFQAWPCLVVATGFQRQQNLTIQEDEPQKAEPEKEKTKATIDKATSTTKPVIAPVLNNQGREVVAGGTLSDALSLSFLVYVEPKLLERARVRVQVEQARDDAGAELLADRAMASRSGTSFSYYGGRDGGIASSVPLLPRQSKGQKLALLRGVVVIRYPMKLQEHEITAFDKPQDFLVNSEDLPVQAQLVPPHLENGRFQFSTSLTLNSERGGHRVNERLRNRMRAREELSEGVLGRYFLPSHYSFIDSQGRTWRGNAGGGGTSLTGMSGKPIPVTSPPTPPPDDFTYTEKREGVLQLVPENAATPYAQETLTPEELAKVRFTKATFTTESDWRTLEVPFEFHDLPLPPR